jgi:hypothetical protein
VWWLWWVDVVECRGASPTANSQECQGRECPGPAGLLTGSKGHPRCEDDVCCCWVCRFTPVRYDIQALSNLPGGGGLKHHIVFSVLAASLRYSLLIQIVYIDVCCCWVCRCTPVWCHVQAISNAQGSKHHTHSFEFDSTRACCIVHKPAATRARQQATLNNK